MNEENLTAEREHIEGDGGPETMDETQVADLKTIIEEIWQDAAGPGAQGVFERRRWAEETRLCYWEGQSPDGRKHADRNLDKEVFPFEGASDHRVRLADMLTNEEVAAKVVAALKAKVKVVGMKADADDWAGKMELLHKWIFSNYLGMDYVRALLRVANWSEGDSPAIAIMAVMWHEETCLQMQQITAQDFAQAVVKLAGGIRNPQDMADLQDLLKNPDREGDAVQVLRKLVPKMKAKRARQVVKDLRETGTAEFPQPYQEAGGPRVIALRNMEDLFFPANTINSLNAARLCAWRRWLTATEIHERAIAEEWSDEFVKEILEKGDGESLFPRWYSDLNRVAGDYSIQTARTASKEQFKGLFEVVTVFQRMTNDDGIPGLYYTTIGQPKFAAHDRKLLDYEHGKYPFVDFTREILTSTLWNSRGIPELVMASQNSIKKHLDLADDNAEIGGLPPILVPHNRPQTPLVLRPLGQIPQRRPGDYGWFPPPPPPGGSEKQIAVISAMTDRYMGRQNPEQPNPALGDLMQLKIEQFLESVREVHVQVMQLCQQYLSPQQLQLITGADGGPLFSGRSEIQGQFHLRLSYDVKDVDPNYVAGQMKVINEGLVVLDRQGTIQYDKLVQTLFHKIDPDMADAVLKPVQSATQQEADDELKNFALIAAGVRPPIPQKPVGMNFGLRLQVMQGIAQQQPWATAELSPVKQKLYAERIQWLQNQIKQYQQNPQIGRTLIAPGPAAGTVQQDQG